MSSAIGVMVAMILAGAVVAFTRAATPAAPNQVAAAARSVSGERIDRRRLAVAACGGFLVLLATGWLLLGVATAALIATWGRLLHDGRSAAERARIEGIAKWLEDLRDTLRGSSVGAEEALEQVAARPPDSIAPALRSFVHRRRLGFRTEDALSDLATELAHPTADAAIAAIRLVVGGSAGAGRLHATVSALAAAARDEVTARERIDRTRAVYQSSMKRLVLIGALLIAYLRFAGGGLLDPYGTATGQIMLVLPLGMWMGCVLWLRSLCGYDTPPRHRVPSSNGRVVSGVPT